MSKCNNINKQQDLMSVKKNKYDNLSINLDMSQI